MNKFLSFLQNGKIFVNGVYKGDLNAYGAQLLNDYNLQMKQWSDNLQQNILNVSYYCFHERLIKYAFHL